eukprot:TRINITY_DN8157_c0_g1_i1.p1 TRINITY_DN8157_c0_g1~~TRINITY_DN8157_c0_g1_i1.p1  ORF type:complete len:226 (-),score=13.72 TRINITY_DN8157_c0_g1_i1:110-787(-)
MPSRPQHIGLVSLQFVLVVLHCFIQMAVVCYGVYALIEDNSVQDTSCDRTYHIFTYSLLSVIGYSVSFGTYFHAKGPEFPRTRALSLALVHSAFGVWGFVTLFQHLSSACKTVFIDHYPAIWGHWNLCAYANVVYGALYLFHEMIWPKFSLTDWTVVPEAATDKGQGGRGPVRTGAPGDKAGQAALNQDLEAEYQKIVQGIPAFNPGGDAPAPNKPAGGSAFALP